MNVQHKFIFSLLLLCALQANHAHFPEYCAECEQEVWEQVPCAAVNSTTTTTTPHASITAPQTTQTTSAPLATTIPIPTIIAATPSYTKTGNDHQSYSYNPHSQSYQDSPTSYTTPQYMPIPIPYTTPSPAHVTSPSSCKKCYCNCKLGCKEFCRKATLANPNQKITQITSSDDHAAGGHVEYTHTHQRKYYPTYGAAPKPYPLVYSDAAAPTSPAPSNIIAPDYTLENLAQPLSTTYGTKKDYEPLPPLPQPEYKPVYEAEYKPENKIEFKPDYKPEYSPVIEADHKPEYKLDYKPDYKPESKPEHRTEYSAVIATDYKPEHKPEYNHAIETNKLEYKRENKPEYSPGIEPGYKLKTESRTSYPTLPQPRTYAVVESLSSAVPQTKVYHAPSAAYGNPPPTPFANQLEPTSSFDTAISNYLKNFGYSNQVRLFY